MVIFLIRCLKPSVYGRGGEVISQSLKLPISFGYLNVYFCVWLCESAGVVCQFCVNNAVCAALCASCLSVYLFVV